jgi:hypothetical protein
MPGWTSRWGRGPLRHAQDDQETVDPGRRFAPAFARVAVVGTRPDGALACRPQRASGGGWARRSLVTQRGRELCADATTAGRAAFAAERSSRALTAARRRSSLSQIGPPALRAAFLRGAARERTGRRRARSCAHATPNATSNAGPRDASVSSMGMPPMCAKGALIIGRSRLCSRRLGGAPRGLARDRRVGRGSRRRSRGRPPSRPRVSS